MAFEFKTTPLEGVIIVKPTVFADNRGFFMETYKKSEFEKYGIAVDFVQDNHSKSTKGVLRGLHFQKEPFAQGKLVRCIRGAIFDVAVDMRKQNKTFGKWFGIELSEDNKLMLWIPPGFAHGFLTLSEEAEIVYKVSGAEYAPAYDSGIIWNDPAIGIQWPLKEYSIEEPILSQKDKMWNYLLKSVDL